MANTDNSFNRERLISLFIKSNSVPGVVDVNTFDDNFTFEDPIDMGSESPVVYSVSPDNGLDKEFRNTEVNVKAKTQSPYFGRKKLKYNRLSGGDLPEIIVTVVAETTIYQVLTKINSKYGLFLTSSDIDDGPIVGPGEVAINLTFKPTSLIFNDHVTVNLTISGGDSATVFGVDDIAGGGDSSPITE